MSVRNAQLSDDTAIVEIWQDNRSLMQSVFEPLGISVPTWNVDIVRSHIANQVSSAKARFGVWLDPNDSNRLNGILFGTHRNTTEEAIIWLIRLVRRANGTVNQAASQTRFINAMNALLEAWFRSAKTDGVTTCVGWYPLTGAAASITYLNNMTSRNGIQPILHPADGGVVPATGWLLPPRKGWRGYVITPDQGLIGIGVVP